MGDKTYACWTGQIWFTDTFEFPPVWDLAEQMRTKKRLQENNVVSGRRGLRIF